jgi:fructan beta-fructosidase
MEVLIMKVLCDSKYLIFPTSHHAQKKRVNFFTDGTLVYDLEIQLDFIDPDYEFYVNVERFEGMELEITCLPEVDLNIRKSDVALPDQGVYNEKYRPGFHFTAKRGWLNDPNGLVHYENEYIMFYQYNPVGCTWGNMHWGHAVSSDLVHWTERKIALYPDFSGTMFSGSAIVDTRNVTGLKENENDAILLFYTAAGSTSETSKGQPFTQCLAYSTDKGVTFKKYERNPLVPQIVAGNRDPKVIYYEPNDSYIMSLYLDNNKFVILSSKNLFDWTQIQEITMPNETECPDFYPLPVDGDEQSIKWVLIGASDKYFIGSFDGYTFKPETDLKRLNYGNSGYAAQSWSNISKEDGRRIRTAHSSITIPSMPFGSVMNFPCEMQLKTFQDEISLCTYPVKEIEGLYQNIKRIENVELASGATYKERLTGRLYDISLKLSPKSAASFSFSVFGLTIEYNSSKHELKCLDSLAPTELYDDCIDLRILVDTIVTEIYINGGKAYMCMSHIQDYNINNIELKAIDNNVEVKELKVAELHNIWNK